MDESDHVAGLGNLLPLGNGIANLVIGHNAQEVCPWNSPKFVQLTGEKDFHRRGDAETKRLVHLMAMTEEEWDVFTRGSAMRRAKRSGLLRNVAVALGNKGSPDAVPVLTKALRDLEPLIRDHAAWALGQIGGEAATEALRDALSLECDPFVTAELMSALGLKNEL